MKAEVLILAKTRMKDRYCVGGITTSGNFVRLLMPDGDNQPVDTEFYPMQFWEVEFERRLNVDAPHNEDILIHSKAYKRNFKGISLLEYLKELNVQIWEGQPTNLFSGMLKWTHNGAGYINKDAVPEVSVGFWVPDVDLFRYDFYEKERYKYNGETSINLPYVGIDDSIDIIPAGSLLRVSLARWWDTDGTTEYRCSLQLSGWFLD